MEINKHLCGSPLLCPLYHSISAIYNEDEASVKSSRRTEIFLWDYSCSPQKESDGERF